MAQHAPQPIVPIAPHPVLQGLPDAHPPAVVHDGPEPVPAVEAVRVRHERLALLRREEPTRPLHGVSVARPLLELPQDVPLEVMEGHRGGSVTSGTHDRSQEHPIRMRVVRKFACPFAFQSGLSAGRGLDPDRCLSREALVRNFAFSNGDFRRFVVFWRFRRCQFAFQRAFSSGVESSSLAVSFPNGQKSFALALVLPHHCCLRQPRAPPRRSDVDFADAERRTRKRSTRIDQRKVTEMRRELEKSAASAGCQGRSRAAMEAAMGLCWVFAHYPRISPVIAVQRGRIGSLLWLDVAAQSAHPSGSRIRARWHRRLTRRNIFNVVS